MQNVTCNPLLRFDFPGGDGRPCSLTFIDPVEVVVANRVDEVIPALEAVQRATDAGMYAAGYVAYEAAPAFDPAFAVRGGITMPLAWFGIFREPTAHYETEDSGPFSVGTWRTSTERSAYDDDIATIHEAIARGDTYQVNYTTRLHADFTGNDLALYHRLRAAQNAAYCAHLRIGERRILSASPELFFRRDSNSITTRPMKGTMRRGRWPDEDAAQSAALAASEKHRAENLMIVDLLRNDLGRIAETGSVRVPSLFDIERYRTVFQMTSTITANLKPRTALDDIFKALFPCGSVTGAPKISTMRQIAALEDTPRQVYCGAIGFAGPGDQAVFNVAIRTVLIDTATGSAEYGVGGGITWDSTAGEEYEEMVAKAAFLTEEWPEFQLLETLLLADGTYTLLERHLARLQDSAAYFDIPCDMAAVRNALDNLSRTLPAGRWRVRLLVAQTGAISVEHFALGAPPELPLRCALAKSPVSRENRFLYHKTTNRSVYEARKAEQRGAFDVLLWNEDGELTEFTIGNLVIEKDGRRWTPPRESGLLAGTFRAELLANGEVDERVLTRADLEAADKVWFINSVRGWLPVEMAD